MSSRTNGTCFRGCSSAAPGRRPACGSAARCAATTGSGNRRNWVSPSKTTNNRTAIARQTHLERQNRARVSLDLWHGRVLVSVATQHRQEMRVRSYRVSNVVETVRRARNCHNEWRQVQLLASGVLRCIESRGHPHASIPWTYDASVSGCRSPSNDSRIVLACPKQRSNAD